MLCCSRRHTSGCPLRTHLCSYACTVKRLPAARAFAFVNPYMYTYICMYTYTHACIYIYIYICVCMRVHCSLVVKRLSAMCVLAGYEAVVRYVVVKRLSAMYVRLSIDVVSDGVDVATTTAAVMVVLRSRPCVCACIAPMHYSCSRPTDPVWVPRRRWATRRMTTHSEEQRRRNMPCPACCSGCNSRRARAAPTMNRHRR